MLKLNRKSAVNILGNIDTWMSLAPPQQTTFAIIAHPSKIDQIILKGPNCLWLPSKSGLRPCKNQLMLIFMPMKRINKICITCDDIIEKRLQ
jgi:hypothetical protein